MRAVDRMLMSLGLLVLLCGRGAAEEAAPRGIAGGSIPATVFQFHSVVPYTPPGSGGWKVACANILFVSVGIPIRSWICETEVGVPEKNFEGPVSDSRAQLVSAWAANLAARQVMSKGGPYVPALVCKDFLEVMGALAGGAGKIPGARVTRFNLCNTHDLPKTSFP